MFRGIYTGASGMLAELARVNTISNNLANSVTVGYKRSQTVNRSFPEVLLYKLYNRQNPLPLGFTGTGAYIDEVVTLNIPGNYVPSENPLDIAIKNGYLVVDTPLGERFTKNGQLVINSDGYLSTVDGYTVLGTRGPIRIQQGGSIVFSSAGEVIVDGQVIDTLRVVTPQGGDAIEKIGENLVNFTPQPVQPEIEQYALELSNVNVVREMVELISAYRAYEANQKVVQAEDGITDRLISDLGRFA
ncbi:flagellar hook-basal body protein [bacterium]|nr:flagellar hook-basal body protein [bacterium]